MFNPESSSESKNPQEIIDFRFRQESAERLVEYIIGMKLDDPEIGDRLITDRKIIREKYHLPEKRGGLTDYDRFLRDLAKKNSVIIKDKSDCGTFFEDYPDSNAAYFRDSNQVGISIDTSTTESYIESILTLEHELIHSLQRRYYPRMPTEIREYEAYVTGISIENIRDYFDNLQSPLFTIFAAPLLRSVQFSYADRSKKEGSEIKPVWDDPYYFLEKVDRLDPVEIEAIRLSKSE